MSMVPPTLVLPGREQGSRRILENHLAIIEELAADPTPWEWWVDQWARNGWTIVQTDCIVRIEKSDDHARDRRRGEFGIACGPERFTFVQDAIGHVLDVVRTMAGHVDQDDEHRADAWILALAATRHPCGTKPDLVRLPSPFARGLSQLDHQRDRGAAPEGEIADMLAAAPSTLSWEAGAWMGGDYDWLSVSNVERLCGAEFDVDPDADPIATLRALERVKGEMRGRTRPDEA